MADLKKTKDLWEILQETDFENFYDKTKEFLLKQGFQESSNVEMIEELVDMIMVSKLYEANTKFILARKQVTGSLINVAMG